MKTESFELGFSVRDYECDLMGIVNNAVYQNYLEHTRHEYLKQNDIHFADMYEKGLNLMVVRAELEYKYSLRSGDSFVVKLRFSPEKRVRFSFYQDIYRVPDNKLILSAKIVGVCINASGKPLRLEAFDPHYSTPDANALARGATI